MNSGDATRLHKFDARAKQTFASIFFANHDKFYEYAIAFVNTSVFKNNLSLINVCNVMDLLINFERNMFGKSLLLNGLVNFCITNSDGATVQHKMLTSVLSFLLSKYY
ncbi:hypothetical protein [Thysanoplusia orichalcea nucleopolyhedrovirus]|uniref:Ac19-like protein n=1 Tax=Thysanoplusia orichalcea nucleopolyhedrovirus TaxID=101850 RepID=L0CJL7_9ABAC|nr:hypothetical protein [Thysanoplusia orichalcea nucleopolyhedrovirus]AGA16174.1 hypothetical protein [Thysanoplusia orichalcea nucleopolyhedrovirus]